MPEVEEFRMDDLGENFQRLDDARTRTIEVLIAVGKEDLPISHNR